MDDDMELAADGFTAKRACDACRSRKIRCDRTAPCSNCRVSKLNCVTTAPVQRAQRQRVHISEEYEKKIDRIEDRLTGIENVLAQLSSRLCNLNIQSAPAEQHNQSKSSRISPGRSPGRSTATIADAATPTPFEGETAINSQSDYARGILAHVVGTTPSIGQNVELRSALGALGELVSKTSQVAAAAGSGDSFINPSLAEVAVENLEQPPWSVVKHVVNTARETQSLGFSLIFPFFRIKGLNEILEEAYHNPQQCSAPRRVLAYGVTYNLLTEFSAAPWRDIDRPTLRRYAMLSKTSLDISISQIDLFLTATHENIMALVLGAATAIHTCRPSLAWVLVSHAAGLCQNLGYHRHHTMKGDTEADRRDKIYMFWMIFMFDKQLSLRLGRASLIQDWDMSLPLVTPSDPDLQWFEAGEIMNYWVRVAQIQGQTYEKLFSPSAFLGTPEQRMRTAVGLIGSMNQAWYDRGEADVKELIGVWGTEPTRKPQPIIMSPGEKEVPSMRKRRQRLKDGIPVDSEEDVSDQVQDILFHSDVVVHYSTCALIQRAVSPEGSNFSQECLEYSRAALNAHMRCNAQFNTKGSEDLWSGYIHWSILQAPFTPFIVLFCNAIQNADRTDIDSLSSFVSSLESCRVVSEGAEKLYKMCHLFLQVAKLYIQAKTQEEAKVGRSKGPRSASQQQNQATYCTPPEDNPPIDLAAMAQFDPYLSALGLMPNCTWPMTGNMQDPSHGGAGAYTELGGIGPDGFDMSFAPPLTGQNPVQDWFSGSRYLMNLMEAGDDLIMPDINDVGL